MIGTTEVRRLSLALAAVALLGGRAASVAAGAGADDHAPKAAKADIYDPAADADAQIAAAVAKAKRDDSRVLVMFGGNWCGWCHKLHALFKSDPKISHELMYEYVLVMVDTEAPNAEKWHERALAALDEQERAEAVGVPFLAVLDGDGAIVDAQATGPLEEGDHHDPAKVLAYLESQEAAPPAAADVLAEGLERAKSEDKLVFLHFGAPWCGWCHRLEDFMARPEIAEILAVDYVDVKVDTDRMAGGAELLERYRGDRAGGIPWFVLLDADGEAIVDSTGPNGNVGFPVMAEEIDHFVAMLRKAKRRMTAEQIDAVERALRANGEQVRTQLGL